MVNEFNTLPQYQSAKEAWYQAGPEFQQGQTRSRTYCSTFDAGDVLSRFVGPGPFCADRHITTNLNDPPDTGFINNNIIPLRTVAQAAADLTGMLTRVIPQFYFSAKEVMSFLHPRKPTSLLYIDTWNCLFYRDYRVLKSFIFQNHYANDLIYLYVNNVSYENKPK